MSEDISSKRLKLSKYTGEDLESRIWFGKKIAIFIAFLMLIWIACVLLKLIDGTLLILVVVFFINLFIFGCAKKIGIGDKDKEIFSQKNIIYKGVVVSARGMAFILTYIFELFLCLFI